MGGILFIAIVTNPSAYDSETLPSLISQYFLHVKPFLLSRDPSAHTKGPPFPSSLWHLPQTNSTFSNTTPSFTASSNATLLHVARKPGSKHRWAGWLSAWSTTHGVRDGSPHATPSSRGQAKPQEEEVPVCSSTVLYLYIYFLATFSFKNMSTVFT